MIQNRDIIVGILDTGERIASEFAEAFCRNLAEYWIVEFACQGVTTLVDKDADGLLRRAADSGCQWLIFSALGCWYEDQTVLLAAVKDHLSRNPDAFLLGHILDRKQNWYELHEQCFVVNLEKYRALGCPRLGERKSGRFQMPAVRRSAENFHDDYTPHWIEAGEGEPQEYARVEFGHGLLRAGIEAGLRLEAFPESLRSAKYYFYPTVAQEFPKKLWWWQDLVRNSQMAYYAFNTEVFPKVYGGPIKPLSALITVSSGLMMFEILHRFDFVKGAKIHFFDNSVMALEARKKTLFEWDGRDYPAFLERLRQPGLHLWRVDESEGKWREFLQRMGGEEAWLQLFNRVRAECDFRFHEFNVFRARFDWQKWTQLKPDKHSSVIFWLSNVFHYRYSCAEFSLEERQMLENEAIKSIANISPDIFVYSMSPQPPRNLAMASGLRPAGENLRDITQVPRFWKGTRYQYPLPVRSFFGKHSDGRMTRPEVPERWRHIRRDNLEVEPRESVEAFAKWIENESKIPWLKMDLEIPREQMWSEARRFRDRFVSHRGDYGNPGWQSLCLHGISAEQTEDYYRYGYESREKTPYRWTDIADGCPFTVNWLLEKWPMERFERVRFMLLKPGGYIEPHSDRDGVRGLCATNVALNQPDACEMMFAHYGKMSWKPGDVCRLDVGVHHSVFNGSDEDRYHMIIHGSHGKRYPEWCRLIVRSFLCAY